MVRVFKNGFIRIQAQWRIPSGSNDLPGELPRGDEIRSIILYNNVSRTVRKLFDLYESERWFSILSSRLFMRSFEARRSVMFFSPSTNLPSHVLSLARPRRWAAKKILALRYRAPSARETNTSSGWMYRENDAYVNQYSSGYSGYLNVDGARVSLRDLKRRSITWIVNPTGRWTHSRLFAACHNENFNTLARLGRPLCATTKGIASMRWRICPLLSHHHCGILNSSDKEHRVTCLARVAAPILKSQLQRLSRIR